MQMPEVNVLIYAHRVESPEHPRYAAWLTDLATATEPFALSDLVCSGFLRIVTNPKIWRPATTLVMAMDFISSLRGLRNCRTVVPGSDHWDIFTTLITSAQARGKLVADAYHAALAIEHGCELVTCDADFARFPGLRWRHPLQSRT